MGVDPLQLLSLGTSAVPMALGLADRFNLRNDELLGNIEEQGINNYNYVAQNNPFGNGVTGWGGQFGYGSDGNALGFGEAQAQALMRMMQQNQAGSALGAYQQLAQQQAPTMYDSTGGLASLLGQQGQGNYQTQGITPQFQNPNVGTQMGSPTGNPIPAYTPQTLERGEFGLNGSSLIDLWREFNGQGTGTTPTGNGGGQQQQQQWWPELQNLFNRGGGNTTQPGSYGKPGRNFTKDMPAQPQTFSANSAQPQLMTAAPPSGAQAPQTQGRQMFSANSTGQQAQFTPNTVQQLFNSPVAYTQQMQDQMYNQAKQGIDAESASSLRQMREAAGRGGYLDTGAQRAQEYQAGQDRLNALSNARMGIQQRAAETNFGNLLNTANLQGGLTQSLGQMQLAQNEQRQGAYNNNVANMGRIIDQSLGIANQDQQRQQSAWQQLSQLGLQGLNLPEQYLSNIESRRYRNVVPTNVPSGPTYIGQQGQGGGDSGSSGMGNALGQMAGYWAAGGFQSPWS